MKKMLSSLFLFLQLLYAVDKMEVFQMSDDLAACLLLPRPVLQNHIHRDLI